MKVLGGEDVENAKKKKKLTKKKNEISSSILYFQPKTLIYNMKPLHFRTKAPIYIIKFPHRGTNIQHQDSKTKH